jgi:1,4-dihydroxy-2-naphthoyl-CoA synthase
MMTGSVLYQQRDHIITLTLNKSESRNLVTDADILTDLNNACERIKNDASIRCVILNVNDWAASPVNLQNSAIVTGRASSIRSLKSSPLRFRPSQP